VVRSIGREISGEIVGHRMEFHIVCANCLASPAVGPAAAGSRS
jgi:hypothetical protein